MFSMDRIQRPEGTDMAEENNAALSDVWSKIAVFLGGIVITGATAFIMYPHNVVTTDQLPTLIKAYTTDSQSLKVQLDAQTLEIQSLQMQVSNLQVDVARIGEHLGVPSANSGKK